MTDEIFAAVAECEPWFLFYFIFLGSTESVQTACPSVGECRQGSQRVLL